MQTWGGEGSGGNPGVCTTTFTPDITSDDAAMDQLDTTTTACTSADQLTGDVATVARQGGVQAGLGAVGGGGVLRAASLTRAHPHPPCYPQHMGGVCGAEERRPGRHVW